MTRQEFLNLPLLNDIEEEIPVDSIVLIPTRRHHDSGYNLFTTVLCNQGKAIGRADLYDVFHFFTSAKHQRIGVDCLRKSSLIRIHFQPKEYVAVPWLYQIYHKDFYKKGE
jgi:hypothetical protein